MKNKDFNYIAGLEKAIKKKFGETAIINPASLWNEDKETSYIKQLRDFVEKQRKHETQIEPENVNGILITKKLLNKDRINICVTCNEAIRTVNDDIYILKFKCCERCYIEYVEDREERWLKGWRPDNVKKST
tara:strand:+ start:1176 stop:1571 length:396 start_codon:yes stop_codon:yes gene_type:complete